MSIFYFQIIQFYRFNLINCFNCQFFFPFGCISIPVWDIASIHNEYRLYGSLNVFCDNPIQNGGQKLVRILTQNNGWQSYCLRDNKILVAIMIFVSVGLELNNKVLLYRFWKQKNLNDKHSAAFFGLANHNFFQTDLIATLLYSSAENKFKTSFWIVRTP